MGNLLTGIGILIVLGSCSTQKQSFTTASCAQLTDEIRTDSKKQHVQLALERICASSVPGSAIAIYSEDSLWTASAGYARIEDKTLMQECHLQYLQSISKTYFAVAILQLYEKGRINLDSAMTAYLPHRYGKYITDADKITIRMILNHTSGIPEYNLAPAYVTRLLQQPDFAFTPEDYIKYIAQKPLDFEPGTRYAYRNTNYLLLALILDQLTGNHARYISENIFQPLNLRNTYYRHEAGYLKSEELVNSYWDRHSNGILENASHLQRRNVAALIGDDGIIATPADAVLFLKGLMEGKLISASTLEEMKTWVKDSKGNDRYGLGLAYATFSGHVAYGHSGGGIGAGCILYYFPEKNIYLFAGINLGTVTDSPIHVNAGKSLEELYESILK